MMDQCIGKLLLLHINYGKKLIFSYLCSSEKCGTTVNILLKYKGHGCCSISHIIIKSPLHG